MILAKGPFFFSYLDHRLLFSPFPRIASEASASIPTRAKYLMRQEYLLYHRKDVPHVFRLRRGPRFHLFSLLAFFCVVMHRDHH